MKENKIFLDSGIMISLGRINKFVTEFMASMQKKDGKSYIKSKGAGYYEFTKEGETLLTSIVEKYKENIAVTLENESINILDQDIENLCNLYTKIMKKEITACVVPTVYKEICVDSTTLKSKDTKDFFNYCNVAVPKSKFYENFAQQTVLFSDDYKVDKFDSNSPDEHYGLADDVHKKDEKSVDVNNEDRWLLAQAELISRLDDEIEFYSGFNLDYNYTALDGKDVSLREYITELCDLTKVFDDERGLIEVEKLKLLTNANKKYLLLHENEKDFGREINGKRSRTYKISNEKSNRNEKLMNEVSEELNSSLKSLELVTPNSRVLKWFLSNEKEYNTNVNELVQKNNLKKLEIKKAEEENAKKLQQELDDQMSMGG